MNLEGILKQVHTTTAEELKRLPKLSYSAIDQFSQCKYRYWLHYEEKNYPKQHAIALSLGSFLHAILEQKGKALIQGKQPYTKEEAIKYSADDFNALKADFFEELATPDKDGRTYDDKLNTFWNNYEREMQGGWKVFGCEKEFYFTYKDSYILHGFIDRVDQNSSGEFRVTDYKSARTIFSPKQRAYSMQMFIYALGMYVNYGRLPKDFQYDFLFFDFDDSRIMPALNKKDSLDKCAEAFDERLTEITNCKTSGAYIPTTSPLCYWCDFCNNNPNADHATKGLCPYYCLWMPDNKTFSVHEKVDRDNFNVKNNKSKKKDIIW